MSFILYFLAVVSVSAQIAPEGLFAGYYINQTLLNCSNSTYANYTTSNYFTLSLLDSAQSIDSDNSDTAVLSVSYLSGNGEVYGQNFSRTSSNPLTWDNFNGISLTYSTNSSTNQTTLFAQYIYQDEANYCWYSYQKDLGLISGTWNFDWQNGNTNAGTVTAFTITSVYNASMTIEATYANGSSKTGFFYRTAMPYSNDIIYEGFGFWAYDPSAGVFYDYSTSHLYSNTGSYLSPEPYLSTWGNPQFNEGVDQSICCAPESIEIYNTTGSPKQLLAQLYFNQTGLARGNCDSFASLEVNGYVPLTISVYGTNLTSLNYSSTEIGDLDGSYSFSIYNENVSASQLTLNVEGNWGDCGFTMSPSSGPGPKFGCLLESKMIVFVFLLFAGFLGAF